MEKKFNHRSGDEQEGRKDEIHSYSSPSATTPKRGTDDKEIESPARRKRIRAYQRIDYWQ
jgi:hypothetical protein